MVNFVSVNIPFPGFYNSWLSDEIDNQESQFAEYRTEETEGEYPDFESYWPEELQIDSHAEILYRVTDYSVAYEATAKLYADAFDNIAGQALGISKIGKVSRHDWKTRKTIKVKVQQYTLQMRFEEMTSPREYNFTTDRLFCQIPLYIMQRLFKRSRDEGHETLAAVIRRKFTSYDGFISHYSHRLADWIDRPLIDWDYNELGTLLIAALEIVGETEESIIRAATKSCIDGDGLCTEWENAVDWPRYESEVREARQEKLIEWADSDPDSLKIWAANNQYDFAALAGESPDFEDISAAIPYRCQKTPDLFEWVRQ